MLFELHSQNAYWIAPSGCFLDCTLRMLFGLHPQDAFLSYTIRMIFEMYPQNGFNCILIMRFQNLDG